MYTVDFVKFLLMLIIAGAMIRLIEYHYPDSWLGRSLGAIY